MIKINLLPKAFRKQAKKYGWFLFAILFVLNIVILGFLYQKNTSDIDRYQRLIEGRKKEIASLQKLRQEYQLLTNERKEMERRLSAINSLKEGRALSARILFDMPALLSENVWLKTYKRTENQFELEGRSVENDSISDLVDAMAKVPYIKTVELKRVEDINEAGINLKKFIIQGTVGL